MIDKRNKYINIEDQTEEKPRFVIIGVGGSGCNTIRRIYEKSNEILKFGTKGVDLVMTNTDYQSLNLNSRRIIENSFDNSLSSDKITEPISAIKVVQLGESGLGAGSDVTSGERAAMESAEQIYGLIENAHIVIIVAGFGGGTGTGAGPVIAEMAKKMDKVVISFVTTPFTFEGKKKDEIARTGLNRMIEKSDTTIAISNQALFTVVNSNTSLNEAYYIADNAVIEIIESSVRMLKYGDLMNVDYADFKKATKQQEGGIGVVGYGFAAGPDSDIRAVEMALSAPLFESTTKDPSLSRLHGATNVLIHIVSKKGPITLSKVENIVTSITKDAHPDATVKVGVTVLNDIQDQKNNESFLTINEQEEEESIKIVFVATGFKQKNFENTEPNKKIEPQNELKDLEEVSFMKNVDDEETNSINNFSDQEKNSFLDDLKEEKKETRKKETSIFRLFKKRLGSL